MTKTMIATTAVALALLASGPARAEAMKMNMPPAAKAKTGVGVGVVRSMDAKAGTVTIQHGPIAAVGWPAMTMSFKATPAVMHAAKVGQKVGFGVRVSGAKAEVTSIKPR